jgi:hypothetical protein
MALTMPTVVAEAEAVSLMAERLMAAFVLMDDLLAHNSGLALDWGAATKPAVITEDAAGNIAGTFWSRQEIANAIGTLAALQTLLDQGHRGNLNLVSRPVGKRT